MLLKSKIIQGDKDMERQCGWCLKKFNVNTGEWEYGPAIKFSITVCCPDCQKKLEEYNKKAA